MECPAETEPQEEKDPRHLAGASGVELYPLGVECPRVEGMDSATARAEEVARDLASRAFSRHMGLDSIGALDAEGVDVIRQGIIRTWEQAGSPAGALHRAAVLSAELPRLVVENQLPADLETAGSSRESEIAMAEQTSAFLSALADEVDTAPDNG